MLTGPAERPNIVFLFADDQRFNTVGALNNPEIRTPNLDRLVAEGTAFTQACIMGGTSGAVCMPSRAMLHTGRSLFRIEGRGESVPEDHTLLGEHFRRNGWRTYGMGKWHNGPQSFNRSFEDGDEIFFGGMADHWNVPACRYDPSGCYEARLPQCVDAWRSNAVEMRCADHVRSGEHSTDVLGDCAVRFLESAPRDKPFFLYLPFLAPHDPRTMPERHRRMYDPETLTLPPNFMGGHPFDNGDLKVRDEQLEEWPRRPERVRKHLAEYYAMISHIDFQVGRVLEALEKRGVAEETIVVFSGDNGLALGSHGLMGKQNLYEHSVRVPLLFRGPGVPRGARRDAPCFLFDLFPTLCALCGLEIPESVEGLSMLGAFDDPEARPRNGLYLAYLHLQRAWREERWKLIEYAVEGRRTTQLFNLFEDPWELCSLADDPAHKKTLGAMRGKLAAARKTWSADHAVEKAFWSDAADLLENASH